MVFFLFNFYLLDRKFCAQNRRCCSFIEYIVLYIYKFLLNYHSPEFLKFPYSNARLPPSSTSNSIPNLKSGDDCEVLTEGKSDDDPSSWWPATIKMMKGEFFVVDYKIQDETRYSDIIPSDKIRIPNRK